MKVTFLTFDEVLASARLRQHIPARELMKLGVQVGEHGDVLICSKHGWPLELMNGYDKIIFDVCDDHLNNKAIGPHYREMCRLADLITCNSSAMQWRIWEEMKMPAKVIPDPYEGELLEPSWGEGLLWFGSGTNLKDLWREVPNLKGYGMAVVSDAAEEGIIPWSPKAMKDALAACSVVILPTGKSPCKSANRMIEAIRAGKVVVANPLPAYEEFSPFVWIGDIREGVDWVHEHQEEALEGVRRAQKYVERFSPERVGAMWLNAVQAVYGMQTPAPSTWQVVQPSILP